MDRPMLYDILYALAAGNGREQTLFGRCAPMSRVAFAGGLAGDAFPEIWFEVPMLGEPRFDLHTLVSHEQLRPDAAFSPGETGGCPEAFAWFARQESGVRQLALSWDLEPDRISAPAVQLLVSGRDPSVIDGFLGSVGRGDGIPAWHAFVSRLPEGWFPCYTGVFPGRPGSGVRVECIPGDHLRQAYARDPDLLREHLARTGFNTFGDTLIPRCRLLAQTPFQLEFQFDVRPDGTAGPVLGASLRFACPPGEAGRPCFDTRKEAGSLMEQIEGWGLADSRWRLLGDTMFATRVTRGEERCLLYCFTAFIKLRWRGGEPLDAKAYLMAGLQEYGAEATE